MTEKIYSEIVRESCLRYVHPSGVMVLMYPMDKLSVSAQFAVRFGSMDNRYRIDGGEERSVPDGTAHYLEHKLFESEEKDAFERFAQTGASANAGTSYESTVYYFTCTDEFEKNLEILLEFVQSPYFTPENVEKERGIISQEITMYDDNPTWRCFMELLKGVYSENPIRTDIAGTRESIAEITDKLLYELYDVFYNPTNMFLCIAGGFDPEKVIEICDRCLKKRPAVNVESVPVNEPAAVAENYREAAMPVGKPLFSIGFKHPDAADGAEAAEEYISYNILLDALFGETSEFYSRHRDSGLLNDAFRDAVFVVRNVILPYITGESDRPEEVLEAIKKEINRAKKEGIPKKDILRVKKATYGSLLKGYNHVENTAQSLTDTALAGIPPFAFIEAAASSDYDKVMQRLNELDAENITLAVVKPL